MGFFDALGKIVSGKPVFENKNQAQQQNDYWDDHLVPHDDDRDPYVHTAQGQTDDKLERVAGGKRTDNSGQKIVPELEVIDLDDRYDSGDTMELWGTIRNRAAFEVFVDKIVIFGQTRELDRALASGEQYQFKLCQTKRPTSDAYKKAELYYRDNAAGDYFCAEHLIEYGVDSAGRWEVKNLRLMRPIKDV